MPQNDPRLLLVIIHVLSPVHVAESLRAWAANDSLHWLEFKKKRPPPMRKQLSRLLYKMGMRDILRGLRLLILGDRKFQVKHRWNFKQLTSVSGLTLYLEQVVADNCSILSIVQKRMMSLRDHNILSVLREQKGVVWLWVCSNFSMTVADTRPELQRSFILFFCSSLRSSLFSRDGVYTRIMMCGLVEMELIWWLEIASESDLFEKDVRQVWEKEVWITHYLLQVVEHLLNNERCKLWIYIKRQLQQVLVQQSPWRSSCFVWHRWRSKEHGRWVEGDKLDLSMLSSQWRLHVSL